MKAVKKNIYIEREKNDNNNCFQVSTLINVGYERKKKQIVLFVRSGGDLIRLFIAKPSFYFNAFYHIRYNAL